jgi:hypothetical protein
LLSLIERDWDLFADTAAHQWLGWPAGEAGRAKADQIWKAITPQIARELRNVRPAWMFRHPPLTQSRSFATAPSQPPQDSRPAGRHGRIRKSLPAPGRRLPGPLGRVAFAARREVWSATAPRIGEAVPAACALLRP